MITVNDYTRDQDFADAALVLDQFGEPQQSFRVLGSRMPLNGTRVFDLALARVLAGE
ncbi:MAG TPA: hypothetical protein VJ437_07200 [Acidiferrobacterales bacterium]|nr:hypothetical protein [Acidiferrobacterales bacterium]